MEGFGAGVRVQGQWAHLGQSRCHPGAAEMWPHSLLELPLPAIPRALHVLPHYSRSHVPPSPAEPLVFLVLQTMEGAIVHALLLLGVIQFKVVLWEDEQTVKVTEELVRQHEEQRRQEMAWLQQIELRSQELAGEAEIAQGSLLLSACQHWWFWAFAEILLVLFAFYWLPRQEGSSAYDSSACGETPAVPRRKRRRRKRMRGIADYGDKLDQIRSPDLCLEWKDKQNSEEEMKGMIDASAKPEKPSHEELLDRAESREYTVIHSQDGCFYHPQTRLYFRCLRIFHFTYKV